MPRGIFLLILLLSSISAWAGRDECSTVDYRASLGRVRDQSPTGWCYANSAADLATHAMGFRVSAFDLATGYLLGDVDDLIESPRSEIQNYLSRHPEFLTRLNRWRNDELKSYLPDQILTEMGLYNLGGMDDDALLFAVQRGYCAESTIPEGEPHMQEHLKAIQDSYENRDRTLDYVRLAPIGNVTEPDSRIKAHIFRDWTDSRCAIRAKPRMPLIPGSHYSAADLKDYNAKLKAGKLNRKIEHRKLFQLIDDKLSQGEIVSIGYDAYDIYSEELRMRTETEVEDGDHSSVIAARKMIKGKCHYYMRVHYGDECSFKKQYNSLCEKDGGVWLPRSALPSIYSVLWIDRLAH